MSALLRRLLREPLLHFLVLGAALFGVFAAINGRSGSQQDRIVVTAGQIEHLATGFTRSWRRPPTMDELNGLIRNYLREEVFYREAKAMGLDRDDPIIRRRLQQKLEFLSEDIAAQAEPTDSDLSALLRSQSGKLSIGGDLTFRHVYLNPERHPDNVVEAAAELLGILKKDGGTADISSLGDRFLPGNDFSSIPVNEVAKLFGSSFAETLDGLTPGAWQGPVRSGYGIHLVFIQERKPGRIPTLDEARETLRREWIETQRNSANEDVFKKLLSRYAVTIEGFEAAVVDVKSAGWVRQ